MRRAGATVRHLLSRAPRRCHDRRLRRRRPLPELEPLDVRRASPACLLFAACAGCTGQNSYTTPRTLGDDRGQAILAPQVVLGPNLAAACDDSSSASLCGKSSAFPLVHGYTGRASASEARSAFTRLRCVGRRWQMECDSNAALRLALSAGSPSPSTRSDRID